MIYIIGFIGTCVAMKVFTKVYSFTLRTATGWEDPETKEFQVKQMNNFLENNKDAEVIELKTGENYF